MCYRKRGHEATINNPRNTQLHPVTAEQHLSGNARNAEKSGNTSVKKNSPFLSTSKTRRRSIVNLTRPQAVNRESIPLSLSLSQDFIPVATSYLCNLDGCIVDISCTTFSFPNILHVCSNGRTEVDNPDIYRSAFDLHIMGIWPRMG